MVFRSSVRSNLCEGKSVDCIFSMTNDIVHVTFNDSYHFVRRVLFLLLYYGYIYVERSSFGVVFAEKLISII